ncbi:MAG: ABC transporter ATP-binding protein [Candidatus Latescibacteria bacterium]|nr:ABC transporter ATP-binding protein [Candidatus Latescibacterota bacterium]
MAEVDVELVEVTKRFGTVTAVDGVSLQVERGEFFALLGPSGCGKTTILRMIAGLEAPTSGAILLRGAHIEEVPAHRRDVNTVFQSYALFPHMSVFDNVAFGLRMKKTAEAEVRRRVEEALDLIQMSGYEGRKPRELSGGQQQRVALARALVNRPAVLLLDEPLGALDMKLRRQMQRELKDIQRRVGITFLFVTHDQEEAMSISDRIAVVQGGRIEQVGSPSEVYERPATRFVADFIGLSNPFEGRVVAREDGRIVVEAGGVRASAASGTMQERACIVVRPERVRIGTETLAGVDHAFEGAVRDVTYVGSGIFYVVDVGGKDLLCFTTGNGGVRHAVGDRVFVGWSAEDGHVVEDT